VRQDRAVRRRGRVVALVNDDQANVVHALAPGGAPKGLHGRHDHVTVDLVAGALHDPDAQVRRDRLKLLRGLIHELVAVREHEHAAPVIRPPPRREVREDDRLTGAGRQYHRGAPDAVRPVRA
jgi:hypothetical protein